MRHDVVRLVIFVVSIGIEWLMWMGLVQLIRRHVEQVARHRWHIGAHQDVLVRTYVGVGLCVTLMLVLALIWLGERF